MSSPAPSASDLDGSSTGGATPVIITVAQAAWLGGAAVVVMGLLLCSVVYCNHRKHKPSSKDGLDHCYQGVCKDRVVEHPSFVVEQMRSATNVPEFGQVRGA